MFTGNRQGMSISAADYMAALAVASSNYDGNDAQRHLHDYYREFYDYDLEQFYYLSNLSVKQILDSIPNLQGDGLVIEIPFAEQDVPQMWAEWKLPR